MVGVIVVVIVAWLALWSFGNDVGGGDGGVVGVVVKGSDVGCFNGSGDMVGPK